MNTPAMQALKVELKGVKHAKFVSEETECFEATLIINGVARGKVYNEGHGGCHGYSDHKACEELEAYAKTLPATKYAGMELPQSADSLVDDAFTAFMDLKDLRRHLKSKLLIVRDGKLLGCAIRKGETAETVLPRVFKEGDAVLNGLDEGVEFPGLYG